MKKNRIGIDGRFLPDPKLYISKEYLLDLYSVKKYSQCKIAKIVKCSQTHICNLLDRYKINKRERFCFRLHEKYIFSKEQEEIITGALLGDGHITKQGLGNSQFTYTSSIRSHVEYIANFFKEVLTEETKNIKKLSYFDKRTNKTYTRYLIRTFNNIVFTELREKWYKEGIKFIPEDTMLTPKTCLVWYMGDGGLVNTGSIKLSTHCFAKEELEKILLPQLKRFDTVLYETEKNNQYITYIPRKKSKYFIGFIGPCPIKEMNYKWALPSYINKKFEKDTYKKHSYLKDEFIKLYKAGRTYYSIAKEYGIEPSAVRYYLIKEKVLNKGK